MRSNKVGIDQHFVKELVGHPAFQSQIGKLMKKNVAAPVSQNSTVPDIVEDICLMLTDSYKKTIDQQTLTVYQTCSQLNKNIELLKQRISLLQVSKTQASFMEKQKYPQMSIFSEMSAVNEGQALPCCLPTNPEEKQQRDMSFMSSILMQHNGRDLREEIQQKLRCSQFHLSEDLSKIESGMTERIKLLELSVNRKIQNIFKTLSTLIESINDLQLKSNHHTPTTTQKNKLQELYDTKVGMPISKDKKVDRSMREKEKEQPRRRSFLGLNL